MVRDPAPGLRTANVYRRGRKYIVVASRRAYYASYLSPPYSVILESASDTELGAAVSAAIDAHVVMAELQSDEAVDAAATELFAVTGVKDLRAFERGASLVCIEARRSTWSVVPYARIRGGWHALAEETVIQLKDPDDEEVGAAVRQAFAVVRGLD